MNETLFEAPHAVPPRSPARDGLGQALHQVRQQLEQLLQAEDELVAELTKHVPPEPGEYEIDCGTVRVRATRPERWNWDKKKLEALYASGPVPDFVKRTVSVDREKFEALPPAEQGLLLPMLKRRASATVKIETEAVA